MHRRPARLLAAVLLRTIVIAAATSALTLPASARAEVRRAYTLYVPKSAPATGKLPLIVVLHCYSCTPEIVVDGLRIDEIADRHGVMLLLPEGRIDHQGERFWSATEACCNFNGAPDDDVTFISGLLDEVIAKRRVDPARVYLVGLSNGGFLAHRLACEMPERIAGFVSVGGAGLLDQARCHANVPVAALEVHGDADTVVPYGGGNLGGDLPIIAKAPSSRASVAAWARRNGCSGEPTLVGEFDLEEVLHGNETRVERWSGCKRPVELWTLRKGPHVPHFSTAFGERIWSFLSQQPPTPSTPR